MAAGAGSSAVLGPIDLGYVAHGLSISNTAVATSSNSGRLKVGCSSFVPDGPNFVDILELDVQQGDLRHTARLPHYFPCSRIRSFGGPGVGAAAQQQKELIGSSGDCLRIWNADSGELLQLMRHKDNPEGVCTPITSFDVAVGAASSSGAVTFASCDVYGMCTLWDGERGAVQHVFDLEQTLVDVAFGPNGLLAVAGEQGDCFLLDTRQSQDVHVLSLRQPCSGPARLAWGAHRPDLIAASWQGQQPGVALYSGSQPGAGVGTAVSEVLPRMLQAGRANGACAAAADLQWSPAYPEMLCCAKEDGVVDVWEFPLAGDDAAAITAAMPCFSWQPKRGDVCTALAMTAEVRSQEHFLVLATMPGQPPMGSLSKGCSGSLWLSRLPPPSRQAA
eukprot:TRINITY_DN75751_c0_g1_i1.p1 TRINITY_DN75751_c0_g1~~TRINITY_DN75751_c0_g1_i1.p1  ORF type:complete len:390 (+),score=59.16 TRINITY_DN75751_c0_g1_i1:65-1234(+)